MKKALIAVTILFAVVALCANSFANTKKNTGCGLGTMIFEGKDGLLSQMCATTTNGILGNQTFGITSGTLGCEKFKGIVSNERLQNFVAQNMDNLASDMSEGKGEYLTTLAVLLEISEPERAAFYGKMQTNFAKIFTSSDVQSTEVVNNIDNILKQS